MSYAIRVALAGTVLLTAAVVAWTVGGDPPGADDSRAQIEAMSQAERDRLRRAYEEYRGLSPSDREAVRRLHETVARDPSLEQTLVDYEAFLATLEPAEREELRQETDDRKRIEGVEKIVAERESRGRRWFAARFVKGPVLAPPQLEEAMGVVVEALKLPASEEEKLGKIEEDHVRHLRIMRMVKANVASDRSREQDRSRARWPDDATAREILKLHPDDEFRERLLAGDESADPGKREWERGFRRTVAVGLLARSLLAEWHAAAFRVVKREDLHRAFEELSQEERNKLAERHPGELVRAAIRDVIAKRTDDVGAFGKEFEEVVGIYTQLDPWTNPHGSPPPFGGPLRRDGDRDNDRRDGDGRDDGRPGDGRRGFGRGPDRDRDGPGRD